MDPSDKFRPEKDEKEFRDFSSSNSKYYSRVRNTYIQMHTNQTYDFAREKVTCMLKRVLWLVKSLAIGFARG